MKTSKQLKLNNSHDDHELVTRGHLREFKTEFKTELKSELKKELTDEFEPKFQRLELRFAQFADAILSEIQAMRQENREFRQWREELYRNDFKQEKMIDELDQRVLKLEVATIS